jgi:hypothetical protein
MAVTPDESFKNRTNLTMSFVSPEAVSKKARGEALTTSSPACSSLHH